MIINETVNIKINNINIKYFKNFYENLKLYDVINVPISQLTKGSSAIINVKCDNCNKEREMRYVEYYRYSNGLGEYLCNKCVKVNTKKTMLEKYGVEYPLQNIEIKSKFKKTSIEKYGVEYPLQNIEIQEKQKNTNIIKYGVDYVSLNNDIREKQTLSKIERIIKKYTNHEFISYDNLNKLIKLKCDKGHIFNINRINLYDRYNYMTTICTICNPIGHQCSGIEKELNNFIEDIYNDNILTNIKTIINPFELDIYLPDLKLAFEFNGV
jgi:hypothetical protein